MTSISLVGIQGSCQNSPDPDWGFSHGSVNPLMADHLWAWTFDICIAAVH